MFVVTSDTFEDEVLRSPTPVVVDFWGPACAPCLALMPQLERLEQAYADKAKFVKIDASKNRRLCMGLRVIGLPTFLFYNNGIEVGKLTGQTISIREIEEQIGKVIAG